MKPDSYIFNLIEEMHQILHRIEGYKDAKEYIAKSNLRFVEDEPKELPFPVAKTPPVQPQEAKILPIKEENRRLEFNEEEISKMPKKFQKLFRTNKVVAHVRLRKEKYYEIRVMIDGEMITASSKSLSRAKERFIEKLYNPAVRKRTPTFASFAEDWLENVSKPFVKQITYDDYATTIRKHLIPAFADKKLSQIDSLTLQKFLNEKGPSRTTEKCFTLLGTLFAYATPKYIPYSPMQYVKKPIYTPQEKKPLSKEEEFTFVRYLFETQNPYRYNFVVILYTGLRRSELKTAVFDEKFVTVHSAKQRFGRPEKLRSIPISPILKKFLPIGELPDVRDDSLSAIFKEINDELGMQHTLHDLRKTFNTRARTCGIPKLLAQFWMGHKPSKDDVNESAYMDYTEEYQLEQIKKFDYEFPFDFSQILPKI